MVAKSGRAGGGNHQTLEQHTDQVLSMLVFAKSYAVHFAFPVLLTIPNSKITMTLTAERRDSQIAQRYCEQSYAAVRLTSTKV
ncbi:hypothetical protein GJ744_001900 [Endocarpon pusillum]|uniref:Uncharacterized protein n=1 Tax=Endocarpon pusillum TaxID=364733 RepID=A0A8H7ASU8_9EURO|nr:hypothetical protein GJ744_001900 [Endocarpon pusillum]